MYLLFGFLALRRQLGDIFLLLLLTLLLAAPSAWAQATPEKLMAACRHRLAVARTDSARGRLNGLLALYAPTVDSTLYFHQLAVTQLDRALPQARGQEQLRLLNLASNDYNQLGIFYGDYKLNRRQAIVYCRRALRLAQQAGNVNFQVLVLGNLGNDYTFIADYAAAMQAFQQSIQLGQQLPPTQQASVSYCLGRLGDLYRALGEDNTAIRCQIRAVQLQTPAVTPEDKANLIDRLIGLTDTYQEGLRDTARAGQTVRRAWQVFTSASNSIKESRTVILHRLGSLYRLEGKWSQARALLLTAQAEARAAKATMLLSLIEANLAMVEAGDQHPALALRYTQQIDAYGSRVHLFNRSRVIGLQAQLYEQLGQPREALAAFHRYMVLRDSLTSEATGRRVLGQLMRDDFQHRTQVLRANQAAATANLRRQRVMLWALLGGLGLLGLLAGQQWHYRRRQQRVNALLSYQKAEIQTQRDQTVQALAELKVAQTLLIQQEKLASVGQLARGIVDRLLNPLNYITNFLQASDETIGEVTETLAQQPLPPPVLDDLQDGLSFVRSNSVKIQEHSASTTRILRDMQRLLKEKSRDFIATDLNKFLDLNVRAAWQEIRSDYPLLTIELVFHLDAQLIQVDLLLVEFRQLVHGLVSNACYALAEKSKTTRDFAPELRVSTQQLAEQVVVWFRDNGKGIAAREVPKLFSPFFTTKPTSKGTGLGLYMAKELIEVHQGTISIDTQEGDFTEIVLVLPIHRV